MAFLVLPISNDSANYEFTTTLDGVKYTISCRYSFGASTWIMDIADGNGGYIFAGIPIRINRDILEQITAYPVPQGIMLAINTYAETLEADRNSFSEEVILTYTEV